MQLNIGYRLGVICTAKAAAQMNEVENGVRSEGTPLGQITGNGMKPQES